MNGLQRVTCIIVVCLPSQLQYKYNVSLKVIPVDKCND